MKAWILEHNRILLPVCYAKQLCMTYGNFVVEGIFILFALFAEAIFAGLLCERQPCGILCKVVTNDALKRICCFSLYWSYFLKPAIFNYVIMTRHR